MRSIRIETIVYYSVMERMEGLMGNKWTDEQQQAIDLRNCSILVSAAAGSGKTAVLVERILKKVMDRDNPINIDSMVIVTFTKAAAGEMRERIRIALEKAAAENPENNHLQKQKTLIHNANITTIDSFCTMILRNHFEKIDLEPSFKVADSGEAGLMQREAVEELLEEYYRKEEQGELSGEFESFVECYASGKSDKTIEDFILELYRFSVSFPWPQKWLDSCESMYECKNLQQFEKSDWVKILKQDVSNSAAHAYYAAENAYNISISEGGPYMYTDTLSEYVNIAKDLTQCDKYSEMYELLVNFKPKGLSAKKDKNVRGELREQAKKYRDECKKTLDNIMKKYFYSSPSIICEDLNKMRGNVHTLVELVKDFIRLYGEKKKEKDLLDFSDLEHFALKVLVDENGNPTEAAKEYADYFEEIMIDEYQDSNYVQELLLSSISKRSKSEENVFMVGDAKQSIYRFRMARPEIFTDKYDTYSTSEGDKRRVDLFKNFRSRKEVLYSVNYIFSHIMKKTLGGIEYDSAAALYPGAQFPEPDIEGTCNTEIMLYDKASIEEEDNMDAHEFEARMIGLRIRQMVLSEKPYMVADKETKLLRPCRFSDIAILVRSNTALAAACSKVFEKMGIPLHVPSKEGYFTTEEIETMLNILRIIDNPLQDIPFTSVLKSPIAALTENELAVISINGDKKTFYEMITEYINQNNNELSDKLKKFMQQLDYFRREVNILPLHEFLWLILDETGFGDYIGAAADGGQKRANMEAFIRKALDFEKTSYIGIFQFVQYIEQIRKYNVDEGEVSVINEQDNTVRIMTVHKSKGLEFPVVFVSGLGSKFNRRDESAPIIMHPKLGFGVNFVDIETRQKRPTIIKQFISNRIHMETVGEELRVLYVAFTRAKEKLILTGGVRELDNALDKAEFSNRNGDIDITTIADAGCYMEWILAALNHHPGMYSFCSGLGRERQMIFEETDWSCNIDFSLYTIRDLIEAKVLEEISREQKEFEFEEMKDKAEVSGELRKMLDYEYSFDTTHIIPVKVSVSELKRLSTDEDFPEEDEGELINIFDESVDYGKEMEPEEEIILPEFLKETEDNVSSVERGLMYHSVFEKLDYNRVGTRQEIGEQIEELFEMGILEKRLKSCMNFNSVYKFVESELGKRMSYAHGNGLLWREQPFILGVGAKEIYQNEKENKTVLVQGIIDAFFEEDGELVLVDYKTDYVEAGMEQTLIERYIKQMDYYEMALSRLFEKNVKERIIYSVGLNKEIRL